MSWWQSLTSTLDRKLALLLVALAAVVYLPLAGNYGLWDPWETHYGEVARQMLERHDFVSQWWPGSPLDKPEFWSKPVLTFWIMALGMGAFGVDGSLATPAELTSSWRVEWALRVPFILLSIAALWAVFAFVRRLGGVRAATLATIALATSSQWVFVTRQAMTDMSFVAPMTIALCLAGLGLLMPEEERELELPRGSFQLGRRVFSYPRTTAFWGFIALFVLTTLPQLVMISIQVKLLMRLGTANLRISGVVAMLPYIVAFVGGLLWAMRARNKRQLYLMSGYVLCGLATLGKGPAGVVLPGLVLVVYLVLAGRWRDILSKLDLPRGIVLFVANCFPWYHAMFIRHNMGFWNEFIGDNYLHRAAGRHGDRGVFDYYAQWTGYAMFPWSGLAAVASLLSLRWLRSASPRRALVAFAVVWLLVEFTVMTVVGTKFHHYIMPALPAAAILVGVFIDRALRAPELSDVILAVLAAPITLLCGLDLAQFPPRLLWLFNYDYVNMPGTGRPWPVTSIFGDRYEYKAQIFVFACAAAAATLAFAAAVWWRWRQREATPVVDVEAELEAEAAAQAQPRPWSGGQLAGFMVAMVGALIGGIMLGPAADHGAAPTVGRWDWLRPTALMLPFLLAPALLLAAWLRRGRWAPWALAAVAVVWSGFIADKLLIELSPHWSQKHVIASYFNKRGSASEPLLAWQLYWRGENFYTKNIIYNSPNPQDRTVFLGERNGDKLQAFLHNQTGKRVFFIVERVRLESLRGLIPAAGKASLKIEDETNNKLYLVSVQL